VKEMTLKDVDDDHSSKKLRQDHTGVAWCVLVLGIFHVLDASDSEERKEKPMSKNKVDRGQTNEDSRHLELDTHTS
jgi:hypothetical protein